ncbi:RNA-binding (RRM/RBD/RNP motifs) family protein [Actinidia rufa]|uniref:RNA-binding (RRM/RBD/RNP motifs) family protein n=1 Tax=Actinidia rufa TaxID=165716 RepID=A0A7J0EUW4_9ERIC|nr:RNA-binding (RRM/RBD/RNP motifs) family protein [Actinidia rufa]
MHLSTSPSSSSSSFVVPKILQHSLSSSLPLRSNLSCFLTFSAASPSSLSYSSKPPLAYSSHHNKSRLSSVSVFALVDEEPLSLNRSSLDPTANVFRPCELYVCNLPRSFGISELLDMFKQYGPVQAVEVSRNPDTGLSRGCGFVTMTSVDDAKSAMAALDGSDVGGREMRVRVSKPKKNLVFESPYKIYVGNIAWRVKPEDLKSHFSQFGTVSSARVLHDRKGGKNRVFGFVSFSSPAECEDAMSLNGTEFFGRTLLLRQAVSKNEA